MLKYLIAFLFSVCSVHKYLHASGTPIPKSSAIISGYFEELSNGTKIEFELKNDVLINEEHLLTKMPYHERMEQSTINKRFKFSVSNISQPRYASISCYELNYLLNFSLIIEPGDSVHVALNNKRMVFTGRNSEKYNCEFELFEIRQKLKVPKQKDSATIVSHFGMADSLAIMSLRRLNTYKAKISPLVYANIKLEIIRFYQYSKLQYFTDFNLINITKYSLEITNQRLNSLNRYVNPLWNSNVRNEIESDNYSIKSQLYLAFILDQYRFDSCILLKQPFHMNDCYNSLEAGYKGATFDRLVFLLLSDGRLRRSNPNDVVNVSSRALASNRIENPKLIALLKTWVVATPGAMAYNFALKGLNGQLVKQSDFLGKIVLLDFWYIGCSACAQLKPYLDSIAELYGRDQIAIISICVESKMDRDYTVEWRKAVDGGKYTTYANINLHVQR